MFTNKGVISKGKSDLGKGTYGIIYSAKQKDLELAIKRNLASKDCDFISVLKEINVLLILRKNPYICNILSYSIEPPFGEKLTDLNSEEYKDYRDDKLYFILEKSNYDLHYYIYNDNGDRSFKNSIIIIYHSLLGLKYMHKNKLIHRDIKPSNILISIKDGELTAKLCDFGFTKFNSSQVLNSPKVCAHWYRAPEIIFYYGNYDYKIDIWSMGLVIYEMFGRKSYLPSKIENDHVKIIENLMRRTHPNENLNYLIKGINDKFEKDSVNFNEEKFGTNYTDRFLWKDNKITKFNEESGTNLHNLEDLLFGMLRFDPYNRYNIDDCLNHKIFTKYRYLLDEYEEKYLSKIKPEERIIKIQDNFERDYAVEIISEIFNNKNNYIYDREKHKKISKKYFWYSHRILFHTIDLFDQYLNLLVENNQKKYSEEKVVNEKYINGYYMNIDEIKMTVYVILYAFFKFFSTFSVDLTFKEFVFTIDNTVNVDGKYNDEAEKLEIEIFINKLFLMTYNVTLFEIADDFNKVNDPSSIIKLFTIYLNNPTINNKSLKEIYQKFDEIRKNKIDKLLDYEF